LPGMKSQSGLDAEEGIRRFRKRGTTDWGCSPTVLVFEKGTSSISRKRETPSDKPTVFGGTIKCTQERKEGIQPK